MISVQHNMVAMYASNNLNIVTGSKQKSTEKLSSGYRINRAADDAAGLAISTKMRNLIRGIDQGTINAQDGVSWCQIGDGALEEVDEMIHRMKDLSIKSLNATNNNSDRAYMQAEFDHLQSEIDRVSRTTTFNTLNIFEDHEPTYYQMEGCKVWPQDQLHNIYVPDNTLEFSYTDADGNTHDNVSFAVPEGSYTTQELIDEIEDAMIASGLTDNGLVFEYTDRGTCSFTAENGTMLDKVSGGLSYLLYDMHKGGSMGALIGTTVFPSDTAKLEITSQNNNMSFIIEDASGHQTNKNITIPNGRYTRDQLIDILNNNLTGTTVTATKFGTGIKLGSDDSIVTGFKGNMFKIDTVDPKYTSVFYDNVKYGNISVSPAYFYGGYVRTTDSRDPEHQVYHIDSTNNTLLFRPNGATTPSTLTIPDGQYTTGQMVNVLNDFFTANGLELKATSDSTTSGSRIKIDSLVKGITSAVGVDNTSSAYNTLFVTKDYYSFTSPSTRNDTGTSFPKFYGAKSFSGSNIPLTITAGSNDTFNVTINSASTAAVKVAAGTYSSAADLANAINNAINDASTDASVRGKIKATVSSNTIVLTAVENSGVRSIRAAQDGSNLGYDNIFVKHVISNNSVSGTNVTCNTPVSEPVTFTTPETFKFTFGGATQTITFDPGTYTRDELAEIISRDFGPTTTDRKFNNISAAGTTSSSASSNVNGNSSYTSSTSSQAGVTEYNQGIAGTFSKNTPPSIKTTVAMKSGYEVTDSNNYMNLKINGIERKITVDNGTYTPAELRAALQSKIDEAFGSYYGGATVSESGGIFTFTSRLNRADGSTEAGADSTISFTTSTSPLIKEIQVTKTAGTATSALAVNDVLTLNDTSNLFPITFTKNGVSGNYTLTLPSGSYTSSSLINAINTQLQAQGIDAVASLSSGKLRLTTSTTGSGNSISFKPADSPAFSNAVYNNYSTPASATTSIGMQSPITITDSTNGFNIKVNGTDYNLTIPSGSYTPATLVSALQNQFTANGVPATVSLSGSSLNFKTTGVGSNQSINLTYATGGSSMPALFGSTTSSPKLTASFTTDGRLKLYSPTGSNISVNSATGSIFETGNTDNKTNPTYADGTSTTSYIHGVALTEPVTIDSSNNDFSFRYYHNGSTYTVNITVPDNTYSFSELENYLKTEIDSQVGGSGKLNTTVTSNGVRIDCTQPGSSFYFGSYTGDFYDRVIGKATEMRANQGVTDRTGNQVDDIPYTVGRKDITKGVEIKPGVNDTLSLDLKINGTTNSFTFTLPGGSYSGPDIVNTIQEKLNEKLAAAGFSENLIKAQIGGVSSGVVGANDDRALVFKLNPSVRLPHDEEGTYIIEGVRGNAAFSVFYETDGELTVAYTAGSKDISEGVTIEDGENDFSFMYDGHTINVTIPSGEYTAEEIKDIVSGQVKASGYPVDATLVDGHLRISATKYGTHSIDGFSGTALPEVFNAINHEEREEKDLNLQFSSIIEDCMGLKRMKMNTVYLGINSVGISKLKYAAKATERLDDALSKVSVVRSYFGATQNRLEHTIANNRNKSENLNASESRLRDTNMATESVAFSNAQILEQAGSAVLAQSNHASEMVLGLLQ